jgi:hypothetical protein
MHHNLLRFELQAEHAPVEALAGAVAAVGNKRVEAPASPEGGRGSPAPKKPSL